MPKGYSACSSHPGSRPFSASQSVGNHVCPDCVSIAHYGSDWTYVGVHFLSVRRVSPAKHLNREGRKWGAYPVQVAEHEDSERDRVGLCVECRYMRRTKSARGSTFYLCERSATDRSFPRYPRLPVLECSGHEQKVVRDASSF
jgi:hypothetical protein